MVISDDYKLVFLHIPKTGGSSIYRALEKAVGARRQNETHTEIVRAKEFLGKKWERYFKFSFVRNPWDRIVSAYEYNRQHKQAFSPGGSLPGVSCFRDWVYWWVEHRKSYQYPYVVENGELVVDLLGRYENLQEDFAEICRRVGVSPVPVLGRYKASPHPPYQEYYCYAGELRRVVGDLFRKDIEIFGYAFGGIRDGS